MAKSKAIKDEIVDKYLVDKYDDISSRYKYMYRLVTSDGREHQETAEPCDIPFTESDQYYEVELRYENRLDLISHKYYGTPLLWWIIAEASNIKNPLRVPRGTLLRIPPRSVISGYGGALF